jgi:hypothetical protein
MKNITTLALGAILLASAGTAAAGPLDFLFGGNPQPRHDDRRDFRDDHRDSRYDNNRRRPSTEARAQQRLRELGYYRGPVDGSFGRGSRDSLARFQRDNRLRPTGSLDERTLRALRL